MRFDLKWLLFVVTLAAISAAFVGARGWFGVIYACFLWSAFVGAVAFRSQRGSLLVLALVIFLASLLAVPIAIMEEHPVPLSRLARVRTGMTERQVQQALGRPTSTEGNSWIYDSALTWCYIAIVFSADGRVEEVVHEH
jgi:hypothetical protein